jgi:hypothetical protein
MNDHAITPNAEKLVQECISLFQKVNSTRVPEIANQRKAKLKDKLADLAATKKRMIKEEKDYEQFVYMMFLKYEIDSSELHDRISNPENYTG